jgi:hypothetical protein
VEGEIHSDASRLDQPVVITAPATGSARSVILAVIKRHDELGTSAQRSRRGLLNYRGTRPNRRVEPAAATPDHIDWRIPYVLEHDPECNVSVTVLARGRNRLHRQNLDGIGRRIGEGAICLTGGDRRGSCCGR